jgi:hypothetical protein
MSTIEIEKRYVDFVDLQGKLLQLKLVALPALPRKKYFERFTMSDVEHEARMKGLERFLRELVARKDTCNADPTIQFLNLDWFFPELIFHKPKIILEKNVGPKEQISAVEFIEEHRIYVVGVLSHPLKLC